MFQGTNSIPGQKRATVRPSDSKSKRMLTGHRPHLGSDTSTRIKALPEHGSYFCRLTAQMGRMFRHAAPACILLLVGLVGVIMHSPTGTRPTTHRSLKDKIVFNEDISFGNKRIKKITTDMEADIIRITDDGRILFQCPGDIIRLLDGENLSKVSVSHKVKQIMKSGKTYTPEWIRKRRGRSRERKSTCKSHRDRAASSKTSFPKHETAPDAPPAIESRPVPETGIAAIQDKIYADAFATRVCAETISQRTSRRDRDSTNSGTAKRRSYSRKGRRRGEFDHTRVSKTQVYKVKGGCNDGITVHCYEDKFIAKKKLRATGDESVTMHKAIMNMTPEQTLHLNRVRHVSKIKDKNEYRGYLEFYEGGTMKDLVEFLERKDERLSTRQVATLFVQLLHAVYSLHKNKMYHLDVADGNIFFDPTQGLKLGDYGYMKSGTPVVEHCVGTPKFMSPEQLQNFVLENRNRFSETKPVNAIAADAYAVGMVAFCLLSGLNVKGIYDLRVDVAHGDASFGMEEVFVHLRDNQPEHNDLALTNTLNTIILLLLDTDSEERQKFMDQLCKGIFDGEEIEGVDLEQLRKIFASKHHYIDPCMRSYIDHALANGVRNKSRKRATRPSNSSPPRPVRRSGSSEDVTDEKKKRSHSKADATPPTRVVRRITGEEDVTPRGKDAETRC